MTGVQESKRAAAQVQELEAKVSIACQIHSVFGPQLLFLLTQQQRPALGPA